MKIAIVILNWNGKELLEKFLPSIIAFSPNADIYVADNASTDNSVTFVEQTFPSIGLIKLPKNYGYAGGYNRALAEISADVFCLINSDVQVTEHWLESIKKLCN